MKRYNRAGFLKMITGDLPEIVTTGSGNEHNDASADNESSIYELKRYSGPWGQEQLLHLLRRTLIGITIEDIGFFEGKSIDQCLDVLLTLSETPPPPVAIGTTEDFADKYSPQGKVWVHEPDIPAMDYECRCLNFKCWWVGLMINQDRSLTEKMTLFWHNHFATETRVVRDGRYSYKHNTLLRANALGNFKKLAYDVTIDPNMLVYLNGNSNIKAAPNENYARELQELFTVGKGPGSHYTEDDVKAAAKVLTGWKDDKINITSRFEPKDHNDDDKHFSEFYNNFVIKGLSGEDGAKETQQLIDMIFAQQEVARYLCRKLYRWFIYHKIDDKVDNEFIIPLANLLIANDFEIKPVLRAIFTSAHFYDPLIIGGLIKSPVDFVIGFLRQLKFVFPPESDLLRLYNSWYSVLNGLQHMYQEPGDPPSVAGWRAYYEAPQFDKAWLDNKLDQRNELVDMLSKDGIVTDGTNFRFDFISFVTKLPKAADPDELIAQSAVLMCPVPIGPKQTAYLKSILLAGSLENDNWGNLWNKYIAKSADEGLKKDVEERLSPLYSSMMKLAEYQLM